MPRDAVSRTAHVGTVGTNGLNLHGCVATSCSCTHPNRATTERDTKKRAPIDRNDRNTAPYDGIRCFDIALNVYPTNNAIGTRLTLCRSTL